MPPLTQADLPATVTTLHDPRLVALQRADALAQLSFFRASLNAEGGFDVLDHAGTPVPDQPQALITTTRLVHSYALGQLAGAADCAQMVDAGMHALWHHHRDRRHGGYLWAPGVAEDKLAYGHAFVLLAASSAKAVGHPDADRLLNDVAQVIDDRFWEDEHGLLADEFRRDWRVFSGYRGMNANMHGVEALLAAHEATGDPVFLDRAGCILAFFTGWMAPAHGWRIPEHYDDAWRVDRSYQGDPMFRPRGTTPGHSFELGRLVLHHWDLAGRPDNGACTTARRLIETALSDAWQPAGGFAYTLDFDGTVDVADRYWWPVTEAIGAIATLIKADPRPADFDWYARMWRCAFDLFIDRERGGWYPEVDGTGQVQQAQFRGKPDLYHALQACLYPLAPGLSRPCDGVRGLLS